MHLKIFFEFTFDSVVKFESDINTYEVEAFKPSAVQDKSPNEINDYSQLIELKKLLGMGILTQEEFAIKKKEILDI